MFCGSLFVLLLLAIVLFVLLRYTDSDYPFGIFKLFIQHGMKHKYTDLIVYQTYQLHQQIASVSNL
jgi:hypothetical protein